MAVIRRVRVLSVFKVALVIYACFGLVVGAIISILSLAGFVVMARQGPAALGLLFGTLAVVLLPVFYGILGGVFGALGAWLYNVAAQFVGGVELELG